MLKLVRKKKYRQEIKREELTVRRREKSKSKLRKGRIDGTPTRKKSVRIELGKN